MLLFKEILISLLDRKLTIKKLFKTIETSASNQITNCKSWKSVLQILQDGFFWNIVEAYIQEQKIHLVKIIRTGGKKISEKFSDVAEAITKN